ncbi:MAG: tRNA pseudouridine synthase B [Melioribacteraceae bacterium]|nr:MAG: tRNA pseudouridine synthase B [Melioribacteraceae bacterium]
MITRTTAPNKIDFSAGEVILIDKVFGYTSFGAVHIIRKTTGVKKVGHAGTLDPNATGLLLICTGKMTKSINEFQELGKEYTGVIELGKRTPSMDTETEVSEEKSVEGITEKDILEARDKFSGKIEQIPPMYSAVKYGGRSLYKFARKGRTVVRAAREAFIKEFEIEEISMPFVRFRISCSKGTYIRVIADDLGTELGCGAYLKELRRTSIGSYKVEDALTVDEFRKIYGRKLEEV